MSRELVERCAERLEVVARIMRLLAPMPTDVAVSVLCEVTARIEGLPGDTPVEPERSVRRLAECVERWPGCEPGGYDPRCSRFPKSCSCEVTPLPEVEPVPVPGPSLDFDPGKPAVGEPRAGVPLGGHVFKMQNGRSKVVYEFVRSRSPDPVDVEVLYPYVAKQMGETHDPRVSRRRTQATVWNLLHVSGVLREEWRDDTTRVLSLAPGDLPERPGT